MRVQTALLALAVSLAAMPALAADTPRDAARAPAAERDEPASADRHCLKNTGTRIRARAGERPRCSAFAGRAYSRDDLERTGRVDIADALRTLDPSIR